MNQDRNEQIQKQRQAGQQNRQADPQPEGEQGADQDRSGGVGGAEPDGGLRPGRTGDGGAER